MAASTLSSRPNLARDALGWLNSRYSLSIDRKADPGDIQRLALVALANLQLDVMVSTLQQAVIVNEEGPS
jgi:hypothetical protein